MEDHTSELEVQRRKFERELAAGTVALVLLAILADAPAPMYGYEIAKRVERDAAGHGPPVAGKQSALYAVLRSLHAAGLLDSHIEPSDAGPPRRYYRITDLGRQVLAEWRRTWSDTTTFVDTILGAPRP
jgi:PadR family transcriptional regulator PadR